MKQKFYTIILSLSIAIIVIACQKEVVSSPILSNNTCDPPCWNSIHPGMTDLDEALTILQQTTTIDQTTIEKSTSLWNGFDRFFFEFPPDVQGIIYGENQTITAITFSPIEKTSMFDKPGSLGITISDAIEKYGLPDSLIITRSYDGFSLLWFYPEKGVSFSYSTYGNLIAGKKELLPDNVVTNIKYFDPKRVSTLIEKGWFSETFLNSEDPQDYFYEWNGYGEIDKLYPPR